METSRITRVCAPCGAVHTGAPMPAGLDPAAWDAYISDGCGVDEMLARVQLAGTLGVSGAGLLEAQAARHAAELHGAGG